MMSIDVLVPGLLTTVQDGGRHHAHGIGVGVAGAADAYSMNVANLLVGNPPTAAVLEINLSGPRLLFRRATTLAICGAHIDAQADGIALPGWRPIYLPARSTVLLGACRAGARVYLAVDGGIAVPEILGSRSTDLRGGFGGFHGRALRAGDRLPLGASHTRRRALDAPIIAPWWIDHEPDLDFAESIAVRVLQGSDATAPSDALLTQEFIVDAASNRQGLRLHGASPLRAANARERVSEPVVPGTVQLPPDGQPIVLLADAQTVGGYPRIGHVIAADLPRLAQRRPGQGLRFIPVDARQAALANAQQRARLGRIAVAMGTVGDWEKATR
ncbi:MAG: biotin-dependent carboxyltransferase family protein [Proteobacteria bacterium]|nr:biotin-dependent carboxyltransferase family protein [Pseudomonadota bacterium]